MSEKCVSPTGDRAAALILAFCDEDALTKGECKELCFNDEQSEILVNALGKGKNAKIDIYERIAMLDANISPTIVDILSGGPFDERKVLRIRANYIAERPTVENLAELRDMGYAARNASSKLIESFFIFHYLNPSIDMEIDIIQTLVVINYTEPFDSPEPVSDEIKSFLGEILHFNVNDQITSAAIDAIYELRSVSHKGMDCLTNIAFDTKRDKSIRSKALRALERAIHRDVSDIGRKLREIRGKLDYLKH